MGVELMEQIKGLNERELLSYWIKGEYEEAETYSLLAERARELGLPDEVVETFRKLAEDSRRHGDELYEIYRAKYGEELADVKVASIEGTHILGKFYKVEDLEDVIRSAMEAEKLAETIYRKLAEESEFRDTYLKLAAIERGHYESLKRLLELRRRS